MKKVFLLAITLMFFCVSCSSGGGNSSSSPNANVATPEIINTIQWPEDKNTSGVPIPDSGVITQVITAHDRRYTAVTLEEISQEEADEYLKVLEDNGFYIQAIASEDMTEEGDVSIGTSYTNDTTGVNVAYFDGIMSIYMAKLEA